MDDYRNLLLISLREEYLEYIKEYKHIYNNTKIYYRYEEMKSKTMRKMMNLNAYLFDIEITENLYKNKPRILNLDEKKSRVSEEIFLLQEDLDYIQVKINSLKYDEFIYKNVIEKKNDVYRLNKTIIEISI